MPIIPPVLTPPYDIVDSILDLTRVRINDAIQSIGGDVLTDDQPFTQEMANAGWRRLQELLANWGYTRCKQEVILSLVPPVATQDPAAQTYISWAGCWNGTGLVIPPDAPVLPQDMILPLRLWERQSNGNGNFIPMTQVLDGLPTGVKLPCEGMWEWREDAIYMPGATITEDIRIRYAGFLPDFLTQGDTDWSEQPVPILRCKNALAYLIAAEAAAPRADLDAESFVQKGEDAAKLIFNREVQQKQRTTATRRPYGRRSGSTYSLGGY